LKKGKGERAKMGMEAEVNYRLLNQRKGIRFSYKRGEPIDFVLGKGME